MDVMGGKITIILKELR